MSAEAPKNPEVTKDPVQEAQDRLNEQLFGKEFNGFVYVSHLQALENSLLKVNTDPRQIYPVLSIFAQQGAIRSQATDDKLTETTLNIMEENYGFKTKSGETVSQPTHTESLPRMSDPKGVKKEKAETLTTTESAQAPEASPAAKRRGRPRKTSPEQQTQQ